MCFHATRVLPHQHWAWAGDEIVPDPVVPASRAIPGTRRRGYPLDLREYLSIERNAVLLRALDAFTASLDPSSRARFSSRGPGAFDFRARTVAELVGALAYLPEGRGVDQWLFPVETLAAGGGDCEDLAFLLAALLEASGVSPYAIRVALGSIVQHGDDERRWDHAWVVYQSELGVWNILEPLRASRVASPRGVGTIAPMIEYEPHFVFNRHHLWRVRAPGAAARARSFTDYVADRSFWEGFSPSFLTEVHESIYDTALSEMNGEQIDAVKQVSLRVDGDLANYDPRDHFDFGYIPEGFSRVERRIATGDVFDFGLAVHAIADFYAHSVYADYGARRDDGSLVPYDPQRPLPEGAITHDFAPYAPIPGCSSSLAEAALAWKGHLITGQWWRRGTGFPADLSGAADFHRRRCLPDHDTIAVDGPAPSRAHRRYPRDEYARQYVDRRAAAIEHIQGAYARWPGR